MFLTQHDGLNNLDKWVTKETVLLNYIEISPVVSDKKTFYSQTALSLIPHLLLVYV